jgi:hypothetical protein
MAQNNDAGIAALKMELEKAKKIIIMYWWIIMKRKSKKNRVLGHRTK